MRTIGALSGRTRCGVFSSNQKTGEALAGALDSPITGTPVKANCDLPLSFFALKKMMKLNLAFF